MAKQMHSVRHHSMNDILNHILSHYPSLSDGNKGVIYDLINRLNALKSDYGYSANQFLQMALWENGHLGLTKTYYHKTRQIETIDSINDLMRNPNRAAELKRLLNSTCPTEICQAYRQIYK
jgi:hypothetical protein